jgi:hypothetical protein
VAWSNANAWLRVFVAFLDRPTQLVNQQHRATSGSRKHANHATTSSIDPGAFSDARSWWAMAFALGPAKA